MDESRLSIPDCADEHTRPRWNPKVATALKQAYACVATGKLDCAASHARSCIAEPMDDLQRIRVLYVLSLDAASRELLQQAFDLTEEALDLAVDADDLDTCATLAYHGASVLHNMQRFIEAADYYEIALDGLRAQEDWDPLRRAPREFDLLVSLAIEAFYHANFEGADSLLAEAARLPLVNADHPLRAARAEWTAALIARWRGDLAVALRHALVAHDIYASHGASIERARMRLALADVYLDFASPPGMIPPTAERGRLIELAERPLMDALASTNVTGDLAGQGLALLAYARYLQITRRDEDAFGTIATAEALGHRLNDLPLIAQAHTARGALLMARGDADQGITNLRSAIEVLRNTDVLVQVAWPLRALVAYEELR